MSQRNLVKEGHRVLIFSQTRKMLNLIQVRFCYFNFFFVLHPALAHLHMTLVIFRLHFFCTLISYCLDPLKTL